MRSTTVFRATLTTNWSFPQSPASRSVTVRPSNGRSRAGRHDVLLTNPRGVFPLKNSKSNSLVAYKTRHERMHTIFYPYRGGDINNNGLLGLREQR